MDTLRSIAERMEHTSIGTVRDGRSGNYCEPSCIKCRLLALCDEAEKTYLVQKWRGLAEMARQTARTIEENSTTLPDFLGHAKPYRELADFYADRADELATWLAARPLTFTVSTAPMDLTGHAPECELWGATAPICSAMAMDGTRKVVFTCTCGKWLAARGIRP